MREIVLDTETTGLDPLTGHRVVEIGCIELLNHLATGRTYHTYINPERDMPAEAEAVHGITAEFLADKPLFGAVVDEFLAFIGESPVVAHNANFDLGFVNAELTRVKRPHLPSERAIDTVLIARRRYPGAPASLDALCKRFQIDTTARTKHGALLDAELLSKVYLELVGGREPGLALTASDLAEGAVAPPPDAVVRTPRPHAPTPAELAAHMTFLKIIKEPMWLRATASVKVVEIALPPEPAADELEEAAV